MADLAEGMIRLKPPWARPSSGQLNEVQVEMWCG
jgi:hypothetical protein